jgi:hypothetical protein
MTQSSTESHSHGSVSGITPFTPGEWAALQSADRQAAGQIVCLLAGVFILGLLGYLVIALIVSS